MDLLRQDLGHLIYDAVEVLSNSKYSASVHCLERPEGILVFMKMRNASTDYLEFNAKITVKDYDGLARVAELLSFIEENYKI